MRSGAKPWLAAALCALLGVACTSPSDEPAPATRDESASLAEGTTPTPPTPPSGEIFVDPEAEPDEGAPPLSVQFTVDVQDQVGSVECEWDFGDGSPKVKGMRPMHVFSKIEDYEIVVRCTDSMGVTGEGEVDVFVEAD